jgi:hypothetical protein
LHETLTALARGASVAIAKGDTINFLESFMKIVTFGKIMLRLAPPGFQRFTQARSFQAIYGGAKRMSRSRWQTTEKKSSSSRGFLKMIWAMPA